MGPWDTQKLCLPLAEPSARILSLPSLYQVPLHPFPFLSFSSHPLSIRNISWTGIQMEHPRRPLSLNLSSSSPARPVSTSPSPLHRQSQSPFRYVQFNQDITNDLDEKATPLTDFAGERTRPPTPGSSAHPQKSRSPMSVTYSDPRYQPRSSRPYHASLSSQSPSSFLRQPAPLLVPNRALSQSSTPYTRPRGLRIANLLRPWLPLILYALTTLAFVVAIALYRNEVFARELC